MNCAACHESLPRAARFCPNCAAPVPQPEPKPEVKPRSTGAQVNVSTRVGEGEATGLRVNEINRVDQIALTIHNPTPEQSQWAMGIQGVPTELKPTKPGAPVNDSTRESLAAMEQQLQALSEELRQNDSTSQQMDRVQIGDVELSRVDLLVKQAVLLRTEAHQMIQSNMEKHGRTNAVAGGGTGPDVPVAEATAKLEEAYDRLRDARRLAPTDPEVLLNLAQIMGDLGKKPREVQPILLRVQQLLDPPRDNTERFHMAQALYLSATLGDDIDSEGVESARKLFSSLGREEWVALCNSKLQEDQDDASAPSPSLASAFPGSAFPASEFAPPPAMPPSMSEVFQPVGRWNVSVSDGTSWVFDFLPSGILQGQGGNMFSGLQPVVGQWAYDPYTGRLQIGGVTGGVMPFGIMLFFQKQEGGAFHALGSDGNTHILKRTQ